MAMEKKELQLLNSLFARYIEKVNNQVKDHEHNESIHDIVEEKMKELLSMVREEDKEDIISEQKTLTLRWEGAKRGLVCIFLKICAGFISRMLKHYICESLY